MTCDGWVQTLTIYIWIVVLVAGHAVVARHQPCAAGTDDMADQLSSNPVPSQRCEGCQCVSW